MTRRNHGFRSGIKRGAIEQESKCGKVGDTMLILHCQCASCRQKQINKFDLLLHADSLKGTRKPNELGRHILTGE
jgi:hypothetical protein